MTVCAEGRHVHPDPPGPFTSLEASFPLLVDCGDDEPFTCCDVNTINQCRADPDDGIPLEQWMSRSRFWRMVERLDEWQHEHHPNICPVAWYRLWQPLCDLRERHYLASE